MTISIEYDEEILVWALSPEAALSTFGFKAATIRVIKARPETPREIEKYKPEAKLYGIKTAR